MSFNLKIILYFLFLVATAYSSFVSGRSNILGEAPAAHEGGPNEDKCRLLHQDLSNIYHKNYDISECNCEKYSAGNIEKDCFKRIACEQNCVKSVNQSGQVEMCNNIGDNFINALCIKNCSNQSASDIQSLLANTSEFDRCVEDQQERIKENLVKQNCSRRIERMEGVKNAKLICGDISCGQYCQRQADEGMRRSNCGNNITTQGGFQNCMEQSGRYLGQELENLSSNLPDGFYWQKCSYGMPCASEIEMAFNQAEQECNNLKAKATICCEEPLKCAEAGTSDLFKSSGAVAGGITQNCKQIQERLSNIGNVTQQMADKCKSIASSCVQVCTQQISENFLSTFNKYCNFNLTTEQAYDRNRHTCEGDLISNYVNVYAEKLAPVPGQCELVGQKSEQLKQSAEEMLRSSASGQKCAEQASVGSSESEPSSPQSPKAPTQMAVLGPDTPNVKTPPTPDTSLRWNPGKGEKGKETIVGGASAGGSSKRASRGASKDPVRRANIGARKAPPPPAKKKKGFLSKLLSAFGGSKKNKGKESTNTSSDPQASASSNNANVGGGGSVAKAKEGLAEKDKTKEHKKSKEHSVRKFSKTGSAQDANKKPRSVLDMGIKPRDISSVKLGKYGSPHDNIFERLSHRIITLCRQKRINDCHL